MIGAGFSQHGLDKAAWFDYLRNYALLWIAAYGTYLALVKFAFDRVENWQHRVITMLILFLLFSPSTAWWVFPLLGAVTETLQRILRFTDEPFFNPAALGALAIGYAGFMPNWWGASFSPRFSILDMDISITMPFTLLLAGWIAHRYMRIPTALSTVAAFSLAYILFLRNDPSYILLEGTFAFFVLVMVIEPKTSPFSTWEQIIYGGIIGLAVPLLLAFGFIETYLGAILLGNLYSRKEFFREFFQKRSVSAPLARSSS